MNLAQPKQPDLPVTSHYGECLNPHFHTFLTPTGVLLVPITKIAEAYCLCLDEQPTATLTFEAAANLYQEIMKGEN